MHQTCNHMIQFFNKDQNCHIIFAQPVNQLTLWNLVLILKSKKKKALKKSLKNLQKLYFISKLMSIPHTLKSISKIALLTSTILPQASQRT